MELSHYEMKINDEAPAHTVEFSGEIDYPATLDINPRLHELTQQCNDELMLDLSAVTYIDSEGIKTLLAVCGWMAEKNGRARIINCSPPVQRVLKITGLEWIVDSGVPPTLAA